jgi:hypothetical protein
LLLNINLGLFWYFHLFGNNFYLLRSFLFLHFTSKILRLYLRGNIDISNLIRFDFGWNYLFIFLINKFQDSVWITYLRFGIELNDRLLISKILYDTALLSSLFKGLFSLFHVLDLEFIAKLLMIVLVHGMDVRLLLGCDLGILDFFHHAGYSFPSILLDWAVEVSFGSDDWLVQHIKLESINTL